MAAPANTGVFVTFEGGDGAGKSTQIRFLARLLEDAGREVVRLREDLDAARSVSSAADSLITTERVAQQQLQQQLRALEAENQSLRADLGFFERLLPAQNG